MQENHLMIEDLDETIKRGVSQYAPLDLSSALFDLDIAGGGRQGESHASWFAGFA